MKTVMIKQWETMEKEFGLDSDGDINVWYVFTRAMKHLCGKTIDPADGFVVWVSPEGYVITEQMVEEI